MSNYNSSNSTPKTRISNTNTSTFDSPTTKLGRRRYEVRNSGSTNKNNSFQSKNRQQNIKDGRMVHTSFKHKKSSFATFGTLESFPSLQHIYTLHENEIKDPSILMDSLSPQHSEDEQKLAKSTSIHMSVKRKNNNQNWETHDRWDEQIDSKTLRTPAHKFRVFLSNIPNKVKNKDIKLALQTLYGPVKQFKRAKPKNGIPQPFGHVSFKLLADTEKCIQAGKFKLKNKEVYTSVFTRQQRELNHQKKQRKIRKQKHRKRNPMRVERVINMNHRNSTNNTIEKKSSQLIRLMKAELYHFSENLRFNLVRPNKKQPTNYRQITRFGC